MNTFGPSGFQMSHGTHVRDPVHLQTAPQYPSAKKNARKTVGAMLSSSTLTTMVINSVGCTRTVLKLGNPNTMAALMLGPRNARVVLQVDRPCARKVSTRALPFFFFAHTLSSARIVQQTLLFLQHSNPHPPP